MWYTDRHVHSYTAFRNKRHRQKQAHPPQHVNVNTTYPMNPQYIQQSKHVSSSTDEHLEFTCENVIVTQPCNRHDTIPPTPSPHRGRVQYLANTRGAGACPPGLSFPSLRAAAVDAACTHEALMVQVQKYGMDHSTSCRFTSLQLYFSLEKNSCCNAHAEGAEKHAWWSAQHVHMHTHTNQTTQAMAHHMYIYKPFPPRTHTHTHTHTHFLILTYVCLHTHTHRHTLHPEATMHSEGYLNPRTYN